MGTNAGSSFGDFLKNLGYQNLRKLPCGTWIGTRDLPLSRALFVGLTRNGWASRFCYQDRELATRASLAFISPADRPLAGFN